MNKFSLLPLIISLFCVSAIAQDQAQMLSDRHVQRGQQCQACHVQMPPKAVNGQACQGCHGGYDVMADKTAELDINPHDSHLEDLDCTGCHHGHKKPTLVCDECHEFDLQVK